MKKAGIILLFTLQAGISFSQMPWNNLIPNYSFESTNIDDFLVSGLGSTEWGLGDMRYIGCSDCFEDLNDYEKIVQYWSYCDSWTVPTRRYPTCGFPRADPICTPDITYEPLTSDDGSNSEFQRHFSGEVCAYTGAGHGEFVIIEPEETIEKNKYYFIEAFVGTFDETDGQTGTIDLFTQKPHVCAYNKYITEYSGNGPSQTVLFCAYPFLGEDSLGWTRYRGFFKASEDFEWLSIGSAGSFYWDDIKIIEVTNNLCRDNWYFDNTVFNYPTEIFQASDFIKAGTGVDPESTHQAGPVTVLSTSHTIFRAGNEIILEDGFEVDSINGAVFEAIIEPCIDLCPPLSIPQQLYTCVTDSMKIGFPELEGTLSTVTWYPTDFLSDPSSPNPTFNPPDANGTIIYTATFEQHCEYDGFTLSGTLVVTIHYSDGLETAPTVSYSDLTYDNYLLETDILVNEVVNEIEICYTTTAAGTRCINYYRGSDYEDGILPFSLNHIFASCCEDVTFNIKAISYCSGEINTSFTWGKEGDLAIIGVLPNVITPLTPDGINDEYCFEVNNACNYTFEVFSRWGSSVFYTGGFITEDILCPWDGKDDDGDMLSADSYWVDIRLYNDCGEEEYRHSLCHILGEGMRPDRLSDSYSVEDQLIRKKDASTIISTNNNQITILSQTSTEKQILIIDNLGRTVFRDSFGESISTILSSGIYYLSIIAEDEIIVKQKIVILR